MTRPVQQLKGGHDHEKRKWVLTRMLRPCITFLEKRQLVIKDDDDGGLMRLSCRVVSSAQNKGEKNLLNEVTAVTPLNRGEKD
mmetsp:Transcript_17886/g.26507  ORF Transcript_17886/g.26507 Transcript_17886/m.26507 type:complete len:83 (-) Transcript_17886:30-278(-)